MGFVGILEKRLRNQMKDEEERFQFEERFHAQDRKQFRKERKQFMEKDRSKYKKSDQDQLKKRLSPALPEGLQRGRVLAITSEGVLVLSEGRYFLCSIKGALKQTRSRVKNLVAVGDFVHFSSQDLSTGVIVFVEERSSLLSRADNLSRKKQQLIAVNIDQVLITASVIYPALKPFLIDRYIIAAEKGNMQPIIVINKIDFLETAPEEIEASFWEKEKALYEEFKKTYSQLGYDFYEVSATTHRGLDKLKEAMHQKTSVISGQSGVGKSSLINALLGTELVVGELAAKTFKGSHTTTSAHLIPLEEGGFCIDTPGITSFGLWELQPSDVRRYFPDILQFAEECRFVDCTHLQEPDCSVQKALEENRISPLRFASYSALMQSLTEEHKNR